MNFISLNLACFFIVAANLGQRFKTISNSGEKINAPKVFTNIPAYIVEYPKNKAACTKNHDEWTLSANCHQVAIESTLFRWLWASGQSVGMDCVVSFTGTCCYSIMHTRPATLHWMLCVCQLACMMFDVGPTAAFPFCYGPEQVSKNEIRSLEEYKEAWLLRRGNITRWCLYFTK